MMIDKIVCCTGLPPKSFAWDYADKSCELHKIYLQFMEYIVEYYAAEGFNRFIAGGTRGVELDFAEAVLRAKDKYPQIRLEIVQPSRYILKQYWDEEASRRYTIFRSADQITYLTEKSPIRSVSVRNKHMIELSDVVVLFWRNSKKRQTKKLTRFAQKHAVLTDFVELPDFADQNAADRFKESFALRKEQDQTVNLIMEKINPFLRKSPRLG